MSAPLPTSAHIVVGGVSLHVLEWGTGRAGHTVFCVPGLTRPGTDFDYLGRSLSADYRVIAVDLPGRGLSEWSTEPERVYRLAWLEGAMIQLLDELECRDVAWLGTSYGGRLGIYVAGGQAGERVKRLVVNDVSPSSTRAVSRAAADRIASFVLNPGVFHHFRDFETWCRSVYEPFGINDNREWRAFAEHSVRRTDDGRYTVNFDRRAYECVKLDPTQLWDRWDAIECPVLLLRGERSDVLPEGVAQDMCARAANCHEQLVPDCGHAPALNTRAQVEIIRGFLESGRS